jgi:2-oxo-4-hydroxy-4-carboxy--5-ureidoimidazoline (OHCU) decarboxylase
MIEIEKVKVEEDNCLAGLAFFYEFDAIFDRKNFIFEYKYEDWPFLKCTAVERNITIPVFLTHFSLFDEE